MWRRAHSPCARWRWPSGAPGRRRLRSLSRPWCRRTRPTPPPTSSSTPRRRTCAPTRRSVTPCTPVGCSTRCRTRPGRPPTHGRTSSPSTARPGPSHRSTWRSTGPSRAIEATADGTALFISGSFSQVNGITRRGLVKYDLVNNQIDPTFLPGNLRTVSDLKLANGAVIAAGNFSSTWWRWTRRPAPTPAPSRSRSPGRSSRATRPGSTTSRSPRTAPGWWPWATSPRSTTRAVRGRSC